MLEKPITEGVGGGASSSMLCFNIPTCQPFMLRLTVDTLFLSDIIQQRDLKQASAVLLTPILRV